MPQDRKIARNLSTHELACLIAWSMEEPNLSLHVWVGCVISMSHKLRLPEFPSILAPPVEGRIFGLRPLLLCITREKIRRSLPLYEEACHAIARFVIPFSPYPRSAHER